MRHAAPFIAAVMLSCASPPPYRPAPPPPTFPTAPLSQRPKTVPHASHGPPPLPPVVVHEKSASRPQFPAIRHATLGSGMSLRVVERPASAVVLLELAITAGTADAAPGVAPLTATLLSDGGGSQQPHQFNDQIAELGDALGITLSSHRTRFRLQVPLAKFEPAVKALAGLVQRPQLLGRHFESWRTWLASQAQRDTLDDDNATAQELFRRVLGSVDGASASGAHRAMKRELERARLEHCKRFYARHYHPANIQLLVVGPVPNASVTESVKRNFSTMPQRGASTSPPRPADTDSRLAPIAPVFVIDRPKAKTNSIHLALSTLPVTPENWPRIQVWRRLLLRRLRAQIASKSGRPIQSRLATYAPGHALLSLHTTSASDEVASTLADLRTEIAQLAHFSPPRQSVVLAQRQIAGRWADRLGTADRVANLLDQYRQLDLPNDYPHQYLSALGKIDPMIAHKLNGSVAATAIIGDALTLAPDLKTLGALSVVVPARGFAPAKFPRTKDDHRAIRTPASSKTR